MYNLLGFKSYVTPRLLGDIKLNYHSYLLEPTTEIDLSSSFFSRHVVFEVNNKPFYLNGNAYTQQKDILDVELGLLYQKISRTNKLHRINVTTFLPLDRNIEINHITYQNTTNKPQSVKVLVATPIYARSADNLRDHRHVTSLLNRIEVIENGVICKPTLSFDERGHKMNHLTYGVYAYSKGLKIDAYYPSLEDYIGDGSLQFPKGLSNRYQIGDKVEGHEALGGISFETIQLKPSETLELYLNLGINENQNQLIDDFRYHQDSFHVNVAFKDMKNYFQHEVSKMQFHMKNEHYSEQLNYIPIQPILRRFQGNSYLPHHDYGKGGRGWRDLWQDLISMIMYNDQECRSLLINNFAGIRIDGSNATIIGDQPGHFIADRNNIVRVWSDHAAWPLLTTKMYIDETGDLDFLFLKQSYFDDQFTHYTKKTKTNINPNHKLMKDDRVVYGTVLEHLILENVIASKNIGKHGYIRLEDADWNDGLDMASKNGETIAFTHFYINNLRILAELVEKSNQSQIELFESLSKLILNSNYKLNDYFDDVRIYNDNKVFMDSLKLQKQLIRLADDLLSNIKENAFNSNGSLQSYIDNDNNYLDSDDTLSLTGQAMALLNQTLSKNEAIRVAKQTKKRLFNRSIGGYKLNSNYHEVKLNMGRAYGFAYGTKENGAVFSHMSLMYAYGLYQYNLVEKGKEAYQSLVDLAFSSNSRVCMGIPEYFDQHGVGKYLYLTGSATWLLKLLRTEVFGIHLNYGELYLNPKLSRSDFIEGKASIHTYLFGKPVRITYYNPKNLNYGDYQIKTILENGKPVENKFKECFGDLEVYLDEIV